MNELGRYDLSNSNLIDIKNLEKDNVSISNHEDVHRNLCGESSYGLLLIMMKKNQVFEPGHNWLMNNLIENMIKMQETLATTIEYLTIYKEQGKVEYEKKIEELKNNTKYYNYYRKLFFSEMKLDRNNIEILSKIGTYSLNINLCDIPFEEFKNKKDFQRFLNKKGNNLRYLPNIRFKTLFNIFFRKTDINKIEQDLDYILDGTVSLEDNADIVKSARKAFKRIYSKSPILNSLLKRIETIDMHHYELYEGVSIELMSSFPIDLNNTLKKNYKIRRLEYNKFWDKFVQYNKDNIIMRFEHLLGGFEEIGIMSLWDLENSIMYTTHYPIEFFEDCVKKSKCPIIFVQDKLFKKVKHKIIGLSDSLPIYLFMDGAISSKIGFILKHFKGGKYTYFQYDNYVTLIIFRGKYVLIQFIIVNLVKELNSLLWKTANIKFVEYGEVDLDKRLLDMISEESMKFSSYALNLLDEMD